jgi:hypothetical protein
LGQALPLFLNCARGSSDATPRSAAAPHTQEASLNPGGLSGGFRTKEGKVVEAGMKGEGEVN